MIPRVDTNYTNVNNALLHTLCTLTCINIYCGCGNDYYMNEINCISNHLVGTGYEMQEIDKDDDVLDNVRDDGKKNCKIHLVYTR